ncbi:MAG TPA: hypothetical protein VE081_06005 [Sporichthyaceae bacterium]|nr:hypothetical protein [Sporichthyaceae bacterium]
MNDLRDYASVQKWLEEPSGRGFQPVREDPQVKLDVLAEFCAHIEVDPDALIETCTDLIPTGQAERNKHLKSLKQWVAAKNLPDGQATRVENTVRGFFIKNGIKVMTRPYADVYRPGLRAGR